jgi:hypothetical protein
VIPQGLGGTAAAFHKGGWEGLDGIGQTNFATGLDTTHRLWQQCLSDVANHPQSLWITLWTGFGRERQVVLPKGFFFLCSRIERFVFLLFFNDLQAVCPL